MVYCLAVLSKNACILSSCKACCWPSILNTSPFASTVVSINSPRVSTLLFNLLVNPSLYETLSTLVLNLLFITFILTCLEGSSGIFPFSSSWTKERFPVAGFTYPVTFFKLPNSAFCWLKIASKTDPSVESILPFISAYWLSNFLLMLPNCFQSPNTLCFACAYWVSVICPLLNKSVCTLKKLAESPDIPNAKFCKVWFVYSSKVLSLSSTSIVLSSISALLCSLSFRISPNWVVRLLATVPQSTVVLVKSRSTYVLKFIFFLAI